MHSLSKRNQMTLQSILYKLWHKLSREPRYAVGVRGFSFCLDENYDFMICSAFPYGFVIFIKIA